MKHRKIINRAKQQQQQRCERDMLTTGTQRPLIKARRRRKAKAPRRLTQLFIKIRNTRKIGYLIIQHPASKMRWTMYIRRTRYNSQEIKELGLTLSAKFRTLIQRAWCACIHLQPWRRPGLLRISTRTVLWALRRARHRNHINYVTIFMPRAHGYRKLKKPARRKRRLQRLRAKRMRYSY